MSGVIHVSHLAPVRYVPRGGSKERLEMARVATPVRLREVDPAEMTPHVRFSGGGYMEMPLYAHGGRLWVKVEGSRVYREDPATGVRLRTSEREPVGRAAFARLLGGDAARMDWADSQALQVFDRTPVLGRSEAQPKPGELFDPATPGRIVADGRTQAAADLRRFLEDEVVLAGDDVFARIPGPVVMGMGARNLQFGYVAYPRHALQGNGYCYFVRPDRQQEFWDMHRRFHGHKDRLFPVTLHGIDPAFFTDDDLTLMANEAPRRVLQEVGMAMRIPGDAARRGALEEVLAVLKPWHDRGLCGGIPLAEAEAAFGVARDALQMLQAVRPGEDEGRDFLARYIDDFALPRLHGLAPRPDDLDALGGLTL